MFQYPFSFNGRIRRTEYGLSIIFFYAYCFLTGFLIGLLRLPAPVMYLLLIPGYWFLLAQGVKRCHDRGNSGWYILIPLYGFIMIFAEGEHGVNYYGPNPKGIGNEESTENY